MSLLILHSSSPCPSPILPGPQGQHTGKLARELSVLLPLGWFIEPWLLCLHNGLAPEDLAMPTFFKKQNVVLYQGQWGSQAGGLFLHPFAQAIRTPGFPENPGMASSSMQPPYSTEWLHSAAQRPPVPASRKSFDSEGREFWFQRWALGVYRTVAGTLEVWKWSELSYI